VHDLPRLFVTLLIFPFLFYNLELKLGTIPFLLDFIMKTVLINAFFFPIGIAIFLYYDTTYL
jgi:hypothetical protein